MSLFSNKAVRLLLSVGVSIWMAGGCLFGCSTGVEEDRPSCHEMQPVETGATSIASPRGMMQDCPLVVNTTAATSKSSAHLPEPGREPVQALPDFEKQTTHMEYARVVPVLHNRGSTHLECCVFLI
ncbi:MAG TPA: hypothetical protein VFI24_00975 [Pyrinomonadaceae bacterium]|nr:hypothetical protein [Pyrinomonadaceae bacterium]